MYMDLSRLRKPALAGLGCSCYRTKWDSGLEEAVRAFLFGNSLCFREATMSYELIKPRMCKQKRKDKKRK